MTCCVIVKDFCTTAYNVFYVISFEVSPVHFHKVVSNFLVSNEALRSESTFWARSLSTVAKLAH